MPASSHGARKSHDPPGSRYRGKESMKKYDIVIIGSGSGGNILEYALGGGYSVAMIDRGPAGGTCLNSGCIPSKLLIAAADRVMEIREAERFGIVSPVEEIDFTSIMEFMRSYVDHQHGSIREGLLSGEGFDFYDEETRFVGDRTLETGDGPVEGGKVFIAAGSRTLIPPVEGLENVPYLTSESLLRLEDPPGSMIIIGGGYIAAEYGHFFSAMGTAVTIVQMEDTLVPGEDAEVSELLTSELSGRMDIHTSMKAVSAERTPNGCRVRAEEMSGGGAGEFEAETLLIAAGRVPNSDTLDPGKTGVETDENGFIVTDAYLETSREGIWAVGDINGREMFTHTANAESRAAWHNAVHEKTRRFDYSAVPHAVFTRPRIASVGLTEKRASAGREVRVSRVEFGDTPRGKAERVGAGFAKAVIDAESGIILGFHIIGPEAPSLIQEVANAMAGGGDAGEILSGVHIHPAMPEIVLRAVIEGY